MRRSDSGTRLPMSVEHGSHGYTEEVSFTSIIASLFLALLVIPEVAEKVTETGDTLTGLAGHGGHH
ncbi:hypothetical protein HYW55_00025 [Candidatus Gottesmanbacteria bacterium]|nr:hypothetical protein [Candidatus Gottesmanbacteria bacterium]